LENGGEFRVTIGRLIAVGSFLIALVGFIPLWWTISDHWMNRVEIEKKLKDHSDHDASVQAWNMYNFAQNRAEYLDDRQAECDAKKMVQEKLGTADAAVCARYAAKLEAKQKEVADLKAKAQETTKEK
jgi:hypothetical protein